jgi:hypothetical protein
LFRDEVAAGPADRLLLGRSRTLWNSSGSTMLSQAEAVFNEKRGAWDPMLELTITSPYLIVNSALQRKSHLCIPFLGIARLIIPNFYIHVSRMSPHIFLPQNKGKPIMGISKPLTDT